MTQATFDPDENRRDFLLLTTSAVGAAGLVGAAWPFIHSMSPSADVVAQATTEVDVAAIEPGQMIVVPQGVEHRPRASEECHVLVIEQAGTVNTGDADESERTVGEGSWI